jgi:hypothetical protein
MTTAMRLAAIPVATVALLGFSSLSAYPRVVCNADGDCWHIHEDYAYPPAAGIIIHPDDWKWKASTTLGVNIPAEVTGKEASGRPFRDPPSHLPHVRFQMSANRSLR